MDLFRRRAEAIRNGLGKGQRGFTFTRVDGVGAGGLRTPAGRKGCRAGKRHGIRVSARACAHRDRVEQRLPTG